VGDIVTPQFLELELADPSMELSELSKLLKNQVLKLYIGGICVSEFPLSFLMECSNPEIVNGKVYINLLFSLLFGDIKLCGLQYHTAHFQLNYQPNFIHVIKSFGIVCTTTFIDRIENNNLCSSWIKEPIQQLSYFDIIPKSENSQDLKSQLHFGGLIKGFFIECENVENISEIKLWLNGVERFNLNRLLVLTKCEKISQNLLYFPFNHTKPWGLRTFESFEGSTNLSLIDTSEIEIKFSSPTKNLRLYALGMNIYSQISGMGGLQLDNSHHSSFD
jgi:hypothetical protein